MVTMVLADPLAADFGAQRADVFPLFRMHMRRQESPAAALFEQGAQHLQFVGKYCMPGDLQAARHGFVRIRCMITCGASESSSSESGCSALGKSVLAA